MKFLLAFLMITFAAVARAQDPQWYQVEVLVFENTDPGAYAAEAWPETPGAPDLQGGATPGAASGVRAVPPERLRLLAEAKRKLADGRYRTLLHTGWIQAATGAGTSRPVRLSASLASGETVEGVVNVGRGKSPQVDLDVLLKRAVDALAPAQLRLRGSRRVRLEEMNYFDHPVLGALVYVSPYSAAAAK